MKPVAYLYWPDWLGPAPLDARTLAALAEVVDGRRGDPLLVLLTGNDGEALVLQEWPDAWDVWSYREPGWPPTGHLGSCQSDFVRAIRAAAQRIILAHRAGPGLFGGDA